MPSIFNSAHFVSGPNISGFFSNTSPALPFIIYIYIHMSVYLFESVFRPIHVRTGFAGFTRLFGIIPLHLPVTFCSKTGQCHGRTHLYFGAPRLSPVEIVLETGPGGTRISKGSSLRKRVTTEKLDKFLYSAVMFLPSDCNTFSTHVAFLVLQITILAHQIQLRLLV